MTTNNFMQPWEEMTVLEQYACQYWDMYKDAYGVRPRGIDTSAWDEASFEAEFVQLSKTIGRHIAELESEAKAMHDFEIRMLDLLMPYTTDRAMALRWLHEAEETNGDDGQPDEAQEWESFDADC